MKSLSLISLLFFLMTIGYGQTPVQVYKTDSIRKAVKWRFVKRNFKVGNNREWYLRDVNSKQNYAGRIQTTGRSTEYTFLNDELVFMRVYTKTFENLEPVNDYYFHKGQLIFTKGEDIILFQNELSGASPFGNKLKDMVSKRRTKNKKTNIL